MRKFSKLAAEGKKKVCVVEVELQVSKVSFELGLQEHPLKIAVALSIQVCFLNASHILLHYTVALNSHSMMLPTYFCTFC